jgi:hypothetical protein
MLQVGATEEEEEEEDDDDDNVSFMGLRNEFG